MSRQKTAAPGTVPAAPIRTEALELIAQGQAGLFRVRTLIRAAWLLNDGPVPTPLLDQARELLMAAVPRVEALERRLDCEPAKLRAPEVVSVFLNDLATVDGMVEAARVLVDAEPAREQDDDLLGAIYLLNEASEDLKELELALARAFHSAREAA